MAQARLAPGSANRVGSRREGFAQLEAGRGARGGREATDQRHSVAGLATDEQAVVEAAAEHVVGCGDRAAGPVARGLASLSA